MENTIGCSDTAIITLAKTAVHVIRKMLRTQDVFEAYIKYIKPTPQKEAMLRTVDRSSPARPLEVTRSILTGHASRL